MSAALLTAVIAAFAAMPASAAKRPLTTGFFDGGFSLPASDARVPRFDLAKQSGARLVRIVVPWSEVAPVAPQAGFNARNPADPGYRWQTTDDAVREARSRGLDVLLTFLSAPSWAEAPGRPGSAPAGTWRPSPAAVGDFASALARRYSGRFADPAGGILPPVRRYQVWNEPNLDNYLSPQYSGSRLRSPALYRAMLNRAYHRIKAVSRKNTVVEAGTAPFGDHRVGGRRTDPALFLREMLCVRLLNKKLRKLSCKDPAHLDAIAHHPYGVRAPDVPALSRDDVTVADASKLVKVLRFAERNRLVRPRKVKQFWVTELAWDSKPPDPDGVPAARQARWLAQSFYLLWKQGVNTITWFQVMDDAEGRGYPFTGQGGVFTVDGTPKPSADAFRFPFAAQRLDRRRVRVWTKAPRSGRVSFQRRAGSSWKTIGTARSGTSNIAFKTVRVRGRAELRALTRGVASRSYPVR